MDLTKYKYLIFDFDGTISKIGTDWVEVRKALHKRFPSIVFTSYSGGLTKIFELFGAESSKEANAICYEFEAKGIESSVHNEKCIQLIKDHQGVKMIWSSNQTDVIKQVLQNIGILDKFVLIVGRDLVNRSKPHHDGYEYIRNRVDADVKKTIFIGDSNSDKEAAKRLKIDYLDVRDL